MTKNPHNKITKILHKIKMITKKQKQKHINKNYNGMSIILK